MSSSVNNNEKIPMISSVKKENAREIVSKANRIMLLLIILFIAPGCGSFWSTGIMKTDLNAFLDGDGEEENADEVGENLSPDALEVVVLPPAPLERCSPEKDAKFSYRRRLAVLAFTIGNRRETVDFPHLEQQYPELLSDVINSERFIVTPASHLRLLAENDGRNGAWVEPKSQQVIQLADDLGVQFIVIGRVVDMSVVNPDVGPVSLVMSFAARKKLIGKIKRNFAVSLSIYDGGTGALIKRQLFADDEYVNAGTLTKRKSLNKAFFRTQFGELMSEMLRRQGDFFLSALDCIPMQVKVVAVDEGAVIIDAGIESLILSGDKLQLFRRKNIGWDINTVKGYRLERYGELTVSSSNPLNAQGVFEEVDMLSGVNPGDIVQAW